MFLELLITMRLCVESEIKQKRKDAFVETRPWGGERRERFWLEEELDFVFEINKGVVEKFDVGFEDRGGRV